MKISLIDKKTLDRTATGINLDKQIRTYLDKNKLAEESRSDTVNRLLYTIIDENKSILTGYNKNAKKILYVLLQFAKYSQDVMMVQHYVDRANYEKNLRKILSQSIAEHDLQDIKDMLQADFPEFVDVLLY